MAIAAGDRLDSIHSLGLIGVSEIQSSGVRIAEGAEIESWFRIQIEGQDYLLWYMRAESMKKVFEVSQTFKHPIDKYHYGLMASITAPKGNIVARPLLDLKV